MKMKTYNRKLIMRFQILASIKMQGTKIILYGSIFLRAVMSPLLKNMLQIYHSHLSLKYKSYS
jgi:hypothetical protein